jgi:hypothetical protein
MRATLFTDPYSGHEVLYLDRNGISCGATYDPQLASSLYPWWSKCPHCQKGRSVDIPSHVRRHVEMLCARSVNWGTKKCPKYSYLLTLDQTGDVYKIVHARNDDEQSVDVVRGDALVAQVRKRDLEDRVVQGDLDSKILLRATRFLMSERPADLQLVAAITLPLEEVCTERRKKPGRRLPCYDLDWQGILRIFAKQ